MPGDIIMNILKAIFIGEYAATLLLNSFRRRTQARMASQKLVLPDITVKETYICTSES